MRYYRVYLTLDKDLHLTIEIAGEPVHDAKEWARAIMRTTSWIEVHYDQALGGSTALLAGASNDMIMIRSSSIVALSMSEGYDEPKSFHWMNHGSYRRGGDPNFDAGSG